jgi:hypothetical protein
VKSGSDWSRFLRGVHCSMGVFHIQVQNDRAYLCGASLSSPRPINPHPHKSIHASSSSGGGGVGDGGLPMPSSAADLLLVIRMREQVGSSSYASRAPRPTTPRPHVVARRQAPARPDLDAARPRHHLDVALSPTPAPSRARPDLDAARPRHCPSPMPPRRRPRPELARPSPPPRP